MRLTTLGRMAGIAVTVGLLPATTAAPVPALKTTEEKSVGWWADLEGDEPAATRAALALSTHPDSTVPFLRTRLKPLTLSAERFDKLVVDLGSEEEKVWRPAFDELRYFDPRLAVEIHTWLRNRVKGADGVDERRLAAVLTDQDPDHFTGQKFHWYSPDQKVLRFSDLDRMGVFINQCDADIEVWRIGTAAPKRTWTRAVRAVVVLEHIGTPEAVAILKEMATGHPDAFPTKAAKDALARLGRK